MPDRSLDSLSPEFRPLAVEFLARLVEARIPVVIVNTGRSVDEQKQNITLGVSWTLDSYHLTGDAIDVAPYAQYMLHGDNKLQWASDPIWERIGQIAEVLGLVWGGRWKQKDLGHVQIDPTRRRRR